MFTLFRFPYSSDMSSAFRRLKVEPEHQRYQLVVFFDFTKENWELYPIVTLQIGLIFGAVQSGTFLELGMEQVADEAETTIAEVMIRNNQKKIVGHPFFTFRSPWNFSLPHETNSQSPILCSVYKSPREDERGL